MPLSGGKYVAPHWVNGGPPALDAAELQAICDTVVKNQTEAGKISGLQSLINGKAKLQIVTYVGTGTYGSNNPTTVRFSFQPMLVVVNAYPNYSYSDELSMIRGVGTGQDGIKSEWLAFRDIKWSGNSVSWWGSSAVDQANYKGYTTYVLAIG